MSTAFGMCILGLLAGMVYYLSAIYFMHRTLEIVVGGSIWYNKVLGGIGILGFILLFAFLISLVSTGKPEKPR